MIRIKELINENLTEEETFCDAEENVPDTYEIEYVVYTDTQELLNEKSNDDDDDYDDDDPYEYVEGKHGFSYVKNTTNGAQSNPQAQKTSTYQPAAKVLSKYDNKMNLDESLRLLPSSATNLYKESEARIENNRKRIKDKSDRATCEQVLDEKTTRVLHKFMQHCKIDSMDGCISTGKEANVYYGVDKVGNPLAIKIYKTAILVFKDRDKYVAGEHRFKRGCPKSSNRKKVEVWAEKEYRNLDKLFKAGLNVPEPKEIKENVLIMSFIGKNRFPAPRLKDVDLSDSRARTIYRQIIEMMWTMYNKCQLVHADLSEYNILYLDGEIYFIDVSQSVLHDHPESLSFLRSDCLNITNFFKNKVATMRVQDLFNFITDPSITDKNMEECLDAFSERAADQLEMTEEEKTAEEVFIHSFIPKTLTDVVNFEDDIAEAKAGKTELVYKTITGLKSDLSGTVQTPEILTEGKSDDDGAESCSDSDNSDSSDETTSKFVNMSRPKNETTEERKARKQHVKGAKAEKRKTKLKKHEKKRIIKLSRR